MRNLQLIILFCGSLLFFGCRPQPPTQDRLHTIPDPKSLNETYVSNPDGLLSTSTVDDMNAKLSPLDQSGLAHIDVVFVNSIGDEVPKSFAHALFNLWKIGDKEKNNGLLILMVKDQHRVEFETGYGLEGVLPDVTCYRIQQDYMVPHAKEGNFDQAVLAGVDAVIQVLKTDGAGTPTAAGIAESASADSANQNIIQPYAEAPSQQNPTVLPSEQKPLDLLGGWPSLIILILYFILARKVAVDITAKRYHLLLNPVFWFLLIFPVAGVVMLDLHYPFSWVTVRDFVLLYVFLALFIPAYFWLLSRRLSRSLEGLTNHEQYLKWQESHASMDWAAKIFPYPFFKAYWKIYQERQTRLRDTPVPCPTCKKAMIRLDEDEDDFNLSEGQIIEEKIGSIDYDVWTCKDCHEKLILDYANLKSEATECPECHFKTRLYQNTQIIQHATTSREGSGYMLYICKNCGYKDKVPYTIARISTSSSSSSSSGSSSSSSTSSGGSSGGGGAGSSW